MAPDPRLSLGFRGPLSLAPFGRPISFSSTGLDWSRCFVSWLHVRACQMSRTVFSLTWKSLETFIAERLSLIEPDSLLSLTLKISTACSSVRDAWNFLRVNFVALFTRSDDRIADSE
jgi:disulfide bond formation protein DsbB